MTGLRTFIWTVTLLPVRTNFSGSISLLNRDDMDIRLESQPPAN